MENDHALRILVQACNETLADARVSRTWLGEMVPALERLCGQLKAEADERG